MIEQRLLRGRLGVDVLGRAAASSLTRPVGPAHQLAMMAWSGRSTSAQARVIEARRKRLGIPLN